MKKLTSSFSFIKNTSFVLLLLILSSCTSHYRVIQRETSQTEINSSIDEQEEMKNYITPFKKMLEDEMNRVIGQSDIRLTKQGNQSETLLGNFFTDVLLESAKKYDNQAQIAFGTKGGLRIELPKGNITVGHIFELMPFENKISILELTGEDLHTLANFIVQSGGQPLSGMKIEAKNNQITQLTVGDEKVDPKRLYKLVTYDYLANGGDNARGISNPKSRQDLDLMVRDALLNYIEKQTQIGQPITSKIDGRITITK